MTSSDAWNTRLRRATLGDVLERRARRDGNASAVVVHLPDGRRVALSYADLDALVNRMSHVLTAEGVGRGDVVATMATNGLDHVVTYYAALKIGAAYTTVNPRLTRTETETQLASARPRVIVAQRGLEPLLANGDAVVIVTESASDSVIATSDLGGRLADAPDRPGDWEVSERDLAMIIYTSGTESEPKGVRIPHRNFLVATSPAWTAERYVEADDRFLLLAPMYTMAGVGTVTNLVAVGATIVMANQVDSTTALRLIESERITNMSQTPTFYLRLTEDPTFVSTDISSLRQAHTYGGAIPEGVTAAMRHASPDVVWATYWGQTELSQLGSIGYYRALDEIPSQDPRWIGRPVPQVEVRVVDEDDAPAEVGELICRSPAVMEGYHGRPDLTAAATRDGWLRTGDIVRIDESHNLYFHDRKKDVIKTGGMNVSSLEVESVLGRIPGVREVAVVGTPDPEWSEAVTAYVVSNGEPPSVEAVLTEARRHLASYKIPKHVHFVGSLPRDSQGKVVKRRLRDGNRD